MIKLLLPRYSFLLILFYLTPCLLQAQLIQTTAKSNKINYERLARIDDLINSYISKDWLKGAVTIVVKDNQLVQYKGYGFADAEAKTPMQKDEIFRIASQTKAITSAGIMILYEQGKLLLDEPVADFIPEFKNPVVLDKFNATDTTYTTVPAKRDITFRDLLTHTSGLDYPGIGSDNMKAIYTKAAVSPGFGITKDETLLNKMKQLAKLPLVHQPGEKWTYGLNCDLLGCLIEVISGTDLETFLMHHIVRWENGYFGADPNYPLVKKNYLSGGADLSSTAFDYAIFLQMIMNGGTYNGHQVLSRRTVETMLTGQLDYMFNGTDNFGLGFMITSEKGAAKGTRSKGTFSWGGFFGTTYWADPKEHLICLIMTQQTPNSHYLVMDKFETMVYSSLK